MAETGQAHAPVSDTPSSYPQRQTNLALLCPANPFAQTLLDQAKLAGIGVNLRAFERGADQVTASLLACIADPAVQVVALCLDEAVFGEAFLSAVARLTAAGKYLVILRTGATASPALPEGIDDASVWRSVLEGEGAVIARSIRELMDIALFLSATSEMPMPVGKGIAIVSGGGGSGVNAADLCSHYGIEVPPLTTASRETLKDLVPPIASLANPIDITPQMHAAQYAPNYPEVLRIIGSDPNIDAVFFPMNAMSRTQNTRSGSVLAFRHATKSAVLMSLNMVDPEEQERLGKVGLYNFVEPERAIVTAARIMAMARQRGRDASTTAPASAIVWPTDVPATNGTLPPDAVRRVMTAIGIPLVEQQQVATREQALAAADALGFPVRLHAAGSGAIAPALNDATALAAAYDQLSPTTPSLVVRPAPKGRLTLRLAAFRHAEFGPMVACSAGGTFSPILDDVVIARAPLSEAQAARLLSGLKVVQAAGKIDRKADLAHAAKAFTALAALAATIPSARYSITIDPLAVSATTAQAGDAAITIGN